MPQDFTKREAKKSLWDLDGQHEDKRYRKKGRNKAKQLIREALKPEEEYDFEWEKEIDEALDCYHYGPCERCLARQEEKDG